MTLNLLTKPNFCTIFSVLLLSVLIVKGVVVVWAYQARHAGGWASGDQLIPSAFVTTSVTRFECAVLGWHRSDALDVAGQLLLLLLLFYVLDRFG